VKLTEFAQEVAASELARRQIDVPARPPAAVNPDDAQDASASSDQDLVPVGRFLDPIEAYLLQSRLEAEGIPALVADALAFHNVPLGSGGVRVLVPESFLARATEIRNEIARGDTALDDK
jgi:hypothetical protein